MLHDLNDSLDCLLALTALVIGKTASLVIPAIENRIAQPIPVLAKDSRTRVWQQHCHR
jgi:hypothetical protein